MLQDLPDNADALADDFRRFVANPEFPCVGAKSALARNQLHFTIGHDIRSTWDDLRIYSALLQFVGRFRAQKTTFLSFVVIFRRPNAIDEETYDNAMWDRLQSLTDKDNWHGQKHDARVSADPTNPHFSLSFGGEAFFAVGMHPGASRPARRFSRPAIIFNLHEQFEELRKSGTYERLRSSIVERDKIFSGTVNPMLQRFGEKSEARQYSGRAVHDDWHCPYHRK